MILIIAALAAFMKPIERLSLPNVDMIKEERK